MNKALQWIIGISIILIVASVIFSTVVPFFAPNTGWYGYGMMGPGHMWGGGMMGGFGFPFMAITMLAFPLLFVGLIVLGIVWLVRATTQTGVAPLATVNCAHCGKPIQAGWKACPHCGEKI